MPKKCRIHSGFLSTNLRNFENYFRSVQDYCAYNAYNTNFSIMELEFEVNGGNELETLDIQKKQKFLKLQKYIFELHTKIFQES